MKDSLVVHTPAVDDNQCSCPRCAPRAPKWSAAQLIARVLIGVTVGASAWIKGVHLNVPPLLVYVVSVGAGLCVAWALTKPRAAAGR